MNIDKAMICCIAILAQYYESWATKAAELSGFLSVTGYAALMGVKLIAVFGGPAIVFPYAFLCIMALADCVFVACNFSAIYYRISMAISAVPEESRHPLLFLRRQMTVSNGGILAVCSSIALFSIKIATAYGWLSFTFPPSLLVTAIGLGLSGIIGMLGVCFFRHRQLRLLAGMLAANVVPPNIMLCQILTYSKDLSADLMRLAANLAANQNGAATVHIDADADYSRNTISYEDVTLCRYFGVPLLILPMNADQNAATEAILGVEARNAIAENGNIDLSGRKLFVKSGTFCLQEDLRAFVEHGIQVHVDPYEFWNLPPGMEFWDKDRVFYS
ncbi:MAG: hypothetical protein LBC42_03790, partial [Puniceicoccales bacterium]|nr:hypothetical protein [Puniceicoccales bacterium]